jgi:uncharacterized glyoxalase superfamily protein PhnB
MKSVRAVPEGFHSLSPHIIVRNAGEAIEFYKKAFGAEELERRTAPDGRLVVHAVLRIGDSRLMLCDEMPMMKHCRSPQSVGGTTVTLHIYTPDVDAVFKRAVKAGAKVVMPLSDMFWGDRYGKLADPFGHEWSLAAHVKDLSPEEIDEAARQAFASMGQGH